MIYSYPTPGYSESHCHHISAIISSSSAFISFAVQPCLGNTRPLQLYIFIGCNRNGLCFQKVRVFINIYFLLYKSLTHVKFCGSLIALIAGIRRSTTGRNVEIKQFRSFGRLRILSGFHNTLYIGICR